jgi:preprotein translocase subunit SecY
MAKAKLGNELSSGGLSELKNRLLFVIIAIVIFRFASYIPIPGLNAEKLANLFSGSGKSFFGMFDMFSGGAFRRMTILALSIMPYISASIIVQMYSSISPQLIQLKKEGEAGRRKINFYTRCGTLILAFVQSIFIVGLLVNKNAVSTSIPIVSFYILGITCLVTGTMFLLWLGEQVTERGIGNGISLIIFSGIVARFPTAIHHLSGQNKNPIVLMSLLLLIVAVTFIVVFVERAQRRITVKYAKRQQGKKMYAAQKSHLPLKINMSGVIPPIFAQSILMFFTSIPEFLGIYDKNLGPHWNWVKAFFLSTRFGTPGYMLIFAVLVIFFGFFYTALVFNPKETSDNLRNQGGYIDGIRPGENTAKYIDTIMTRLTCVGTIYLALVALLPMFLIKAYNVPFYFGGTSLLIVVVVLMDFIAQVQSHLLSSHYQSLMNKANSRGSGGGLLRG